MRLKLSIALLLALGISVLYYATLPSIHIEVTPELRTLLLRFDKEYENLEYMKSLDSHFNLIFPIDTPYTDAVHKAEMLFDKDTLFSISGNFSGNIREGVAFDFADYPNLISPNKYFVVSIYDTENGIADVYLGLNEWSASQE